MKPFCISVDRSVLDDLRDRLTRTRWPEAIPNSGWRYGLDHLDVKALCEYWLSTYDWRAHESRLNQIPQFTARLDDVEIHFFHVRAQRRPTATLLLLHGWPGSIVEFVDLIEPLTNPVGDDQLPVFDLVVPSMPGFGFSGKPREPGWSADRIADAFCRLMTEELGYERFGIQGGDWGTIVGTRIAHRHPSAVTGLHINMPFGYPPDPSSAAAQDFAKFMQVETGYLHLQNTKPDAISMAQCDSPAGLAAWILEKFRTWSDCDGRVFDTFSYDTLITNLMFYWAPNSISSAARIYFESVDLDPPIFLQPRIAVPTAVAAFPKEPYLVPREWLESRFNIVSWTSMPRGGHFPALEEPKLLLRDIRRFFGQYST